MAIDVQRSLDFGGVRRIQNLPDAVAAQEPVTLSQFQSGIEGLAWKDNVRVATQSNINLAAPGATIDGVTMVSGNRTLVQAQTNQTENGIYIWNGAAVVMTRSSDASTGAELLNALVPVDEGTIGAGTIRRQSAINITIGSSNIVFGAFVATTAPATDTSLGTVELATQGEVDSGVSTTLVVTANTLANSVYASKKINQTIGDGSANLYTITHNFGTRDVDVDVYRNSGNYDTVFVEIRRPSINSIDVVFDTAPTLNSYRVVVKA